MNDFTSLQDHWGKFLSEGETYMYDIKNLDFFRELQRISRHQPEILPEDGFYVQAQAGFYRWRILDICTKEGNEYKVNYHFFPSSQTYIHSHGYEGNSWVLDGNLEYRNFLPHKLSIKDKNIFFILLNSLDLKQKIKIQQELQACLMGENEDISSITRYFAAMLGGAGLFSDKIAQKNHETLENKARDFGVFALPHQIMGICQNNENVFRLEGQKAGRVGVGNSYHFGHDVAHCVKVPKVAQTLFLTRKIKGRSFHEGEFLQFPEARVESTPKGKQETSGNIKEYMLAALAKLEI